MIDFFLLSSRKKLELMLAQYVLGQINVTKMSIVQPKVAAEL